jgi:hypothetical protein
MTQLPEPSPVAQPSHPATPPNPDASAPGLRSLPGFWDGQLPHAAPGPRAWLWQGYLAPGNVTLLTSQWKSGKTTLVAVLFARMAQGGTLAGLAVKPGKAVVISEECHLNWHQRGQRLHFGGNLTFLCRPFAGKPTWEEWSALIDALVKARHEESVDLVVIDPLANFLPGRYENIADGLLEILMPLQRLTTLGVAVLILHHPRKGKVHAGVVQKPRRSRSPPRDRGLFTSRRNSAPPRHRAVHGWNRLRFPRRPPRRRLHRDLGNLAKGPLVRPPPPDARRNPPPLAPNPKETRRSHPLALAPTRPERRRHRPRRRRKEKRPLPVSTGIGAAVIQRDVVVQHPSALSRCAFSLLVPRRRIDASLLGNCPRRVQAARTF